LESGWEKYDCGIWIEGVGVEPPTGLFHLNMCCPSKLKTEIAPMTGTFMAIPNTTKTVIDRVFSDIDKYQDLIYLYR